MCIYIYIYISICNFKKNTKILITDLFKLAEQILLKEKVQYPVDLEGVASMRFQMAMALVKNSGIKD